MEHCSYFQIQSLLAAPAVRVAGEENPDRHPVFASANGHAQSSIVTNSAALSKAPHRRSRSDINQGAATCSISHASLKPLAA